MTLNAYVFVQSLNAAEFYLQSIHQHLKLQIAHIGATARSLWTTSSMQRVVMATIGQNLTILVTRGLDAFSGLPRTVSDVTL